MLRFGKLSGVLLLGSLSFFAGCYDVGALQGESKLGMRTSSASASIGPEPGAMPNRYFAAAPPADAGVPANDVNGLPGAGAAATASGVQRKIIYTAHVELVVEDFGPVADNVAAMVKKFDGYIADSTLGGASGSSRRGTWKIRVPVFPPVVC